MVNYAILHTNNMGVLYVLVSESYRSASQDEAIRSVSVRSHSPITE
jgi:hypothetical protein